MEPRFWWRKSHHSPLWQTHKVNLSPPPSSSPRKCITWSTADDREIDFEGRISDCTPAKLHKGLMKLYFRNIRESFLLFQSEFQWNTHLPWDLEEEETLFSPKKLSLNRQIPQRSVEIMTVRERDIDVHLFLPSSPSRVIVIAAAVKIPFCVSSSTSPGKSATSTFDNFVFPTAARECTDVRPRCPFWIALLWHVFE